MMTPPLSIWARPDLTLKVPVSVPVSIAIEGASVHNTAACFVTTLYSLQFRSYNKCNEPQSVIGFHGLRTWQGVGHSKIRRKQK